MVLTLKYNILHRSLTSCGISIIRSLHAGNCAATM